MENRSLVIELEQKVLEQERTIQLLKRKEKHRSQSECDDNIRYSCGRCVTQSSNVHTCSISDIQYTNLHRQIEIQALETRLRALKLRPFKTYQYKQQ